MTTPSDVLDGDIGTFQGMKLQLPDTYTLAIKYKTSVQLFLYNLKEHVI